MNRKKGLFTIFLLSIIFWIITFDLMNKYNNILLYDYSYLEATWEIFKITCWRVPLMIFCILVIFV